MRIRLLGPLQIEGDGSEIGPRDRVVLEALAVRPGQVVSADRLADALWSGEPPVSWPKVVQGCVVRLRRTLGADAIKTDSGGYRLELTGDDLDTTEFDRLAERGRSQAATGEPEQAAATFTRALALWRGSPFGDLDAWSPGRSEAARLDELRRTTEEDLLDARLAAGEHREAAVEAEARVAEEPLRERRWAILALAQWRCARQADALRSLHLARQTLAEQLGVDPGPELVALEDAILRQDPSLAAGPESMPAAIECPYKGLAPYEAADAYNFFGRDAEVSACLRRLASWPLLVVAGPSGCGKSSLVRAGVVPALVRAARSVIVLVPGSDADAALTSALASTDGIPMLVVDQLEETFTLNEPDAARAFCARLAAYAADMAPVIVTVRADHLASLGAEARFTEMAEHGLHLVRPLQGDALRAAIEGPAAQAGLRLEHGLVDLLIRDTEGEPGALPLLSHALAETWASRDGRVLTVEGYQSTGGIRAAVARSADRLYESLPPDQRAVLRSVMLRMVAPSADGDPVRSRIPARSLGADPSRDRVVSLLVRARLVTAEADTVELAHEALARAWPRLRSWLEEDAEGQKIFRHLAAAADGWDALGRQPSELYRGARLARALEWRAGARPDITELETEFLDASVAGAASERAALARQNRRLRRLLLGVALLLVAALVAGSVAVWQRQRADANGRQAAAQERQAGLRAMVSDSLALRNTNRDTAALLAVEAHQLDPSAGSENALFSTFTGAPGLERIGHFHGEGYPTALFFSDNKTVAVGESDGAVHLIDVRSGTETATLPGMDAKGFVLMSVSPDARWLAVAARNVDFNTDQVRITVWDLSTRQQRFVVKGFPFIPGSIAVNRDASIVAVSGGDEGRTAVLDGATGALRQELTRMPRPPDAQQVVRTAAVIFNADGQLVVASEAGPIRWIDPTSGTEIRRIDALPETSEYSLRPSPDGSSIVTIGELGMMHYDLASGKPLWPAPVKEPACDQLAWAVRLGALLCTDRRSGQLLAVDPTTGVSKGNRYDTGLGSGVGVVSPDGTTLVEVAGDESAYSVWRLDDTGPVTARLNNLDAQWVNGYSADGALLVGHASQPLRLVDPVSGAVLGQLDGVEALVPNVTGGEPAAIYLDHTLGWYDLDRRVAAGPKAPLPYPVELPIPLDQATGIRGVLVFGRRAVVWTNEEATDHWQLRAQSVDLDQGTPVAPTIDAGEEWPRWLLASDADHLFTVDSVQAIEQHDLQTGAIVSRPENRYNDIITAGPGAVVANMNGTVVQVDPGQLAPVGASFPGSRGSISGMALSGDGSRVLQIGNLSTRLYDMATRTELGDAFATADGVAGAIFGLLDTGVVLRRDGKAGAVVTGDGGVISWDLDADQWAAKACAIAGRNLTTAEWTKHIGKLDQYHAICPQFAIT